MILRTPERLALRQRDTLLALESCVERLAAQVTDLQSLVRRARRCSDERINQLSGAGTCPGTLPNTLAYRRRALGLSQRAIAGAVGYSRSEVSELERETRQNPETLRDYAGALEHLEHEARRRRTGLPGVVASGAPASPTHTPTPPEALS